LINTVAVHRRGGLSRRIYQARPDVNTQSHSKPTSYHSHVPKIKDFDIRSGREKLVRFIGDGPVSTTARAWRELSDCPLVFPETLSFDSRQAVALLRELESGALGVEPAVIFTCNRTEFYMVLLYYVARLQSMQSLGFHD